MRPTTEDLLKLRDGEPVSAALAGELDDPEVRQEVARLDQLRRELCALPELQPPAGIWRKVRRQLDSTASAGNEPLARRWHWPARLALAASVTLVAVMLLSRAFDGPRVNDSAPSTTVADVDPIAPDRAPIINPSYASLAAESRRLERLLTELTYQPRVTRAGTASTIAELEDRIAFVDYQLVGVAGTNLTSRQRAALWQQRVDLMNSLVKVRYAHARGSEF